MEILFQINGSQSTYLMSLLAMVITTILSIIITKVYQLTFTGERYSQNFVHTIIIMSVVVSVIMKVVSGNAGVAFGLFAVFSLIRFRSAVTDAKDIAYIFFGLSVGMTSGLYHFDLAILLTVFSCLLFYLLYTYKYGQGKDTQILKVTVPENLNHETLLDDIFNHLTISHSLRQVETTNLGTLILYAYAIRSRHEVNDDATRNRTRTRSARLKVAPTYREQ